MYICLGSDLTIIAACSNIRQISFNFPCEQFLLSRTSNDLSYPPRNNRNKLQVEIQRTCRYRIQKKPPSPKKSPETSSRKSISQKCKNMQGWLPQKTNQTRWDSHDNTFSDYHPYIDLSNHTHHNLPCLHTNHTHYTTHSPSQLHLLYTQNSLNGHHKLLPQGFFQGGAGGHSPPLENFLPPSWRIQSSNFKTVRIKIIELQAYNRSVWLAQ